MRLSLETRESGLRRRSPWRGRAQARELLLRAALLDDERAREAWLEFCSAFALEDLPQGSYPLLPVLRERVVEWDDRDALLPRLSGISRHTWARNRVALRQLAAALEALSTASVHALVYGDCALLLRYYRSLELRPMGRLDVLVRNEDVDEALRALTLAGWVALASDPGRMFLRRHFVPLVGGSGFVLCLSGDFLPEVTPTRLLAASTASVWHASEAIDVLGQPARAPAPTHELLAACVRCPTTLSGRAQQLLDAKWILKARGSSVDWEQLVDEAAMRAAVLALRRLVSDLNDIDASLPLELLARLRAQTVSAHDRLASGLGSLDSKAFGSLPHMLAGFLRSNSDRSIPGALLGLPVFLRDAWDREHAWSVPAAATSRARSLVTREASRRPPEKGWRLAQSLVESSPTPTKQPRAAGPK